MVFDILTMQFLHLISVHQWRKNGPYTGSFFNRGQPCMILKWQTNNLLLFVYVWHQNCLGSVYHIDRPVNNNKRAFHALSTSKICVKYRKHGSSPFSQTFNCACFSLFLPTKVHIKAKIDLFLTIMLLNFFVRTLQCAKTLILKLFCPWKHEK